MRNLDECKAEILRLGDKKIKQRKKRRMRVLSVCVPLCLCLVVASVVVLPTMLPTNEPMMSPPVCDTMMPDFNYNDGLAEIGRLNYTKAEIKGLSVVSFYNQVNETIKINYISDLINNLYEINDGGFDINLNERPETGSTNEPPYSNGSHDMVSSYLISFTAENGFKVEYTLSGSLLIKNSTGKSVRLTPEEHKQLLEVFR